MGQEALKILPKQYSKYMKKEERKTGVPKMIKVLNIIYFGLFL